MEEEVEDVKVEVDGGHDVFLWGQLVQHHLGVHDDEEGEENCTSDGDASIQEGTREEDLHDAKQRRFCSKL